MVEKDRLIHNSRIDQRFGNDEWESDLEAFSSYFGLVCTCVQGFDMGIAGWLFGAALGAWARCSWLFCRGNVAHQVPHTSQ